MRHVADDCLSTFVHRDVLHRDLLLAPGSVSPKRFDLRREGSGKLVEAPLRTVLLLFSGPAMHNSGD